MLGAPGGRPPPGPPRRRRSRQGGTRSPGGGSKRGRSPSARPEPWRPIAERPARRAFAEVRRQDAGPVRGLAPSRRITANACDHVVVAFADVFRDRAPGCRWRVGQLAGHLIGELLRRPVRLGEASRQPEEQARLERQHDGEHRDEANRDAPMQAAEPDRIRHRRTCTRTPTVRMVRIRRIFLQFPAKALDQRIDAPDGDVRILAPDPLDESVAAEDDAAIAGQHVEQLELVRRQLDLAVAEFAWRAPAQPEVPGLHGRRVLADERPAPPQQGARPAPPARGRRKVWSSNRRRRCRGRALCRLRPGAR